MFDVLTALKDLPPVFDLSQAATVGLSGRVVQRAVLGHLVRKVARGAFVAEALWRESSPREIDGLRVTSPARTVIDCLRELPLPDAVAIADAAVRRGLVEAADLEAVRHEQRGWPFITSADTGLLLLDPSRETWFESWSFIRLWQLGVKLPESQVEVYDQRGRFLGRVDGLWRDDATVAEADGLGKYLGEFDPGGASAEAAARAVVAEKIREDRMRECGLEFVRWDLSMMLANPTGVAEHVANARRRGDLSRFIGRLVPDSSPLDAAKPPVPLLRAG